MLEVLEVLICMLAVVSIVWIVNHRRSQELDKKLDFLRNNIKEGRIVNSDELLAAMTDLRTPAEKNYRRLRSSFLWIGIGFGLLTVFVLINIGVIEDNAPDYVTIRYILAGIALAIGFSKLFATRHNSNAGNDWHNAGNDCHNVDNDKR